MRFFYTSSQLVLLLTNTNNLMPSANFGSSLLTPFSRSHINLNCTDPQEFLWRFFTTHFLLLWFPTLNPHTDFPSCGMAKSDILGDSNSVLSFRSSSCSAGLCVSLILHSKPLLWIPVTTSATFLPHRQEIYRYSACLSTPIPQVPAKLKGDLQIHQPSFSKMLFSWFWGKLEPGMKDCCRDLSCMTDTKHHTGDWNLRRKKRHHFCWLFSFTKQSL